MGRFVSADTIVPSPGDPQSLNRYSYVLNSPLNYRDPSDHCIPGQCLGDVGWEDTTPIIGGILFTVDEGQSWNARDQDMILGAADAIAHSMVGALIQRNREYAKMGDFDLMVHAFSPAALFKQVMGDVTFKIMPQCLENGCLDGVDSDAWAWSRIGDLGEVWVNEYAFARGYTGFAAELNTVHELGHGIDQRGGRVASSDLAASPAWSDGALRRTNGGFAAGRGWQQSKEDTASEVFADMFLGWTYNRWEDSRAGAARSRYMEANMPRTIALAVTGN